MTWKIEKWLADVFPGRDNIYKEYSHLRPRELVIVACGVLDIALAELLSLRLAGLDKEIEEFLGADGNGNAPVGNFGARIQLARLTGILEERDVRILKSFRKLRNIMAHRVKVSLLDKDCQSQIFSIFEHFPPVPKAIHYSFESQRALERFLPKYEEACCGLLLAAFSVYQAYFHRLHGRVERIQGCVRRAGTNGNDKRR